MKHFFLLFLLCILPAAAQPKPIKNSCPVPNTLFSLRDTSTEHKIKQSTLYLQANYFQNKGSYNKALQAYRYLFALDAPNYIYDGYLRLLSQANQFKAIVALIDKTQDLFKDDLDIQLIYAQSLLNTSHDKQAEKLLHQLKNKYPTNERVAYYSATHSEKTNNLQKALDDISAFLKKTPLRTKHFLFYFLQAKILLKMKKVPESLRAINKCLTLHGRFDKGILFKALLLEQTGNIAQAIESYKNFVNVTGYNPSINKHIVKLLFTQNKFTQAAEQLKKMGKKESRGGALSSEYHFDLALIEWKAQKPENALKNAKKALAKNKTLKQAKILITDILFHLRKDNEIFAQTKNWLNETPNDNISIYKLIALSQRAPERISPNKIISVLTNVTNKHKKQCNLHLAIGDLSLRTKGYDVALDNYQKAFDSTNDEELHARIVFQKAFIHANKDEKISEKNIKKALQELDKDLRAVYLPSLHLKGDCFMRLGRLSDAHRAIDETLAHTSKLSPFYKACILDTRAQIYNKEKKYHLELQTLEQAHKLSPKDKIIKEHLDDARTRN